jgi:hypothetical protein
MNKIIPALLMCTFFFAACKERKEGEVKLSKEGKQEVMENKSNRVSPPATAADTIDENMVTINYGSPKVKGRVIWGDLVPYSEVWRTGANEATTIEFTKDVFIEKQPLTKGVYALFTIPAENEWTIIFSTNNKQWGAFKYNEAEDALRIKIKPSATDSLYEDMLFTVLPDAVKNSAGVVQFNWEKLQWGFSFANAVAE